MPPIKSMAEFMKFVNSAVYTLQGFLILQTLSPSSLF